MGGEKGKKPEQTTMDMLEYAALRNAPLSMSKPELLGKEPMPRGRFLVPQDGAIIVENLQVPGRTVDISVGCILEAFFQYDGRLYNFRTRVLEMDAPVQLNGTVMVRGMKVSAPKTVDAGNRRQIYRQSFASVNPRVDVQVWAIPRDVLTPDQAERLGQMESSAGGVDNSLEEGGEFVIERGEAEHNQLSSANLVRTSVLGLELSQMTELMKKPPHWTGEIADASEFGIGLTVHDVVYSRLKIFQPLAIRFKLPDIEAPMDFLYEIRRVQKLKEEGARLGGLLLVNAINENEIRTSRELAAFALKVQRERARLKSA